MSHYPIILISIVLFSYSCHSTVNEKKEEEQKYNEEAIALNNRATELMMMKPDSALILLNQSTEIDPNYYIAHFNKVSLLHSMGEIDDAIKAAEKGVEANPDLAELSTSLGMMYDYRGHTDKAKVQYSKALKIYNDRIENLDKNKFGNRASRAHTLLLLGEQEMGQKEVRELLQEKPDDPSIQMLKDFDKQQFLKDLFQIDQRTPQ